MSDKRHTHERYRGGGRERHDRWNRADRYSPSERRATGDRHRSGTTDRGQPEGATHRTRTASRDSTRESRTDERGYGQSAERADRDSVELPAGGRQLPGERRLPAGPFRPADLRRTGDWSGPDDWTRSGEPAGIRDSAAATGERYRQRYDQPVGRDHSRRETRHHRFQGRRSTGEGWRSRTGDRDADRGSGESDGEREQPRDPETGRFLSKDEADGR